ELRHAPFALWINDLSAPDRLMVGGVGVPVLTLFMGASMFVQQWLTPQQGDPSQQRMMMYAARVYLHVHQLPGRARPVLAREQRAHHRAAVPDDALYEVGAVHAIHRERSGYDR